MLYEGKDTNHIVKHGQFQQLRMLAPKHLRFAYGTVALTYFGLRLTMAIAEHQGIMQMPPYAADAAMVGAIFVGALVGIRMYLHKDTDSASD